MFEIFRAKLLNAHAVDRWPISILLLRRRSLRSHLTSMLNEIERSLNSGFSRFVFRVTKDLTAPKLTAFKNLFKKTKNNY
ncbi:unknown protein [Microcystis aeruginosa NIES-843]|uniref:Uncharacterized protein n=1 Tax=Microcystis aeruginosa (strain NIES-843 / IAM M-2473) TaxID=449447 RepID=B0JQQ7_MICAN|nr:unknown protein [Microcystis aeruginosa NIES-843]